MGEVLWLWVDDSNLLIAWLVVLRQGLTLEPRLALNSWKSSYLRLPNAEVTSHHTDLYLILIAWFYSTNLQLVPFNGAWSVDSSQLAPELLQVNTQKPEAFCSCPEMGEVILISSPSCLPGEESINTARQAWAFAAQCLRLEDFLPHSAPIVPHLLGFLIEVGFRPAR